MPNGVTATIFSGQWKEQRTYLLNIGQLNTHLVSVIFSHQWLIATSIGCSFSLVPHLCWADISVIRPVNGRDIVGFSNRLFRSHKKNRLFRLRSLWTFVSSSPWRWFARRLGAGFNPFSSSSVFLRNFIWVQVDQIYRLHTPTQHLTHTNNV
jgi:hypothetical protein